MRKSFIGVLLLASLVHAQRVKDIVRVQGLEEIHLKGFGLVVGLGGTGDSTRNEVLQQTFRSFLEAMRAIPGRDEFLQDPNALKEIRTKNVAVVVLTGKVQLPMRRGTPFDVTVSSIGDAESLRGGRLLETPLFSYGHAPEDEKDERYVAVAQGDVISPEGQSKATTGTARAILRVDIERPFHTNYEDVTLVLHHPDFSTANRIARTVNEFPPFHRILDPGETIATAMGPDSVRVRIPNAYLKSGRIVDFISRVLSEVEVPEVDHTATVVMDAKSGTLVVSPMVRVAVPIFVQVKGTSLLIRLEGPAEEAGEHPRLVDVLDDLRSRMSLTNVDLVGVIRAIYKSGALKGTLEEL